MISETGLQPLRDAATPRRSRCCIYHWQADDGITLSDIREHAEHVVRWHQLDGPVEFADSDSPELFGDRPAARRLLEEIQPGDHLVLSDLSIPVSLEYVITVNRLLRAGVHVHAASAEYLSSYDSDEPELLYAAERELLTVLRDHSFHRAAVRDLEQRAAASDGAISPGPDDYRDDVDVFAILFTKASTEEGEV